MAKECGISQPTAKSWLTVLEATYVVRLLRPFHVNTTKRLVKGPKLYFVDTGLLCYLLGVDNPERPLRSADRGLIFENMVVMDAVKHAATRAARTRFSFYRSASGVEVDLIVEHGDRRHAFEIKMSKSPTRGMARALTAFQREFGSDSARLLCLREDPLAFSHEVTACHWTTFAQTVFGAEPEGGSR